MQSASSKKKILVKSFPLQGNDFDLKATWQ
jgi:hypothetical protein